MQETVPLPAHASQARAGVPIRLAALAIAAGAIACLWTSLAAILNFAWRYPAFDQFRLYRYYLGLPFPANAIQIENGHRPILPALVRIAEARWFAADQTLQIAVGMGAILLALGLVLATILRERALPPLSRTCACALAVLALFWLGNARMLMHGNELVHAYFVVLFAVAAILATIRAASAPQPLAWTTLAALACLCATFSFGTGMASFGAALLLGLVLRLRPRDFVPIAGLLVVALAVYLLGLPGNGGVQATLRLDPAQNLAVCARWLSAPWIQAWFGFGDPSFQPWMQSALGRTAAGTAMLAAARWMAAPWGPAPIMRESLVVGLAGLGGFLAVALHAASRGRSSGGARLLGLGLATFGACAAAIVCFARLQYFLAVPDQIFADRYLPWSCLFWFGLALYAIAGAGPRSPWRRAVLAGSVLAVLLVAVPMQRLLAGWSATVYRHVQQSAVAAQLGLWDGERMSYAPAATDEDVHATLDLLRRGRLSMFAEPAYALVQGEWSLPADAPPPLPGAEAHVVRQFDDAESHRHVADFEGWLPRLDGLADDAVIAVVDGAGALRGLAKFGFIGPGKSSLRFGVPVKRGFDGYVLDARPGERLSVRVLDAAHARVLATVPLDIPAAAPAP